MTEQEKYMAQALALAREAAAAGEVPVGCVIVRGGEKVAAVRPADPPENALPAENPWRGFIPALYGKAFSLPDDSVCAAVSGWIICGSDEAVRDFMAAQTLLLETDWPRKGDHIVIYKSGTILCWNKKGISLWSSIL